MKTVKRIVAVVLVIAAALLIGYFVFTGIQMSGTVEVEYEQTG